MTSRHCKPFNHDPVYYNMSKNIRVRLVGFEPTTPRLKAECIYPAELQAHIVFNSILRISSSSMQLIPLRFSFHFYFLWDGSDSSTMQFGFTDRLTNPGRRPLFICCDGEFRNLGSLLNRQTLFL